MARGHETNTLAQAGEHTQGPEVAFTPDPKVARTRGRVEECIQALEAALTRAPVAVSFGRSSTMDLVRDD